MSEPTQSIHFRILSDIARDLSGDINFPTCMDAAILVRDTLKDRLADLNRVAQVVGIEPLISSKLLRLANSVSYNPSGRAITDLSAAIARLGFEVVRTMSLAVTIDQLLKSRNLSAYDAIARQTWEHSIHVAAIARVLARRLGCANPDDAMLGGLVHDIGIFYLLYRAAEYPEYRDNEAAILELLKGWHESIGESLLQTLGLPEKITDAVGIHDQPQDIEVPGNLAELLHFANLLAQDKAPAPVETNISPNFPATRERYAELLDEAEEDIRELHAALGG